MRTRSAHQDGRVAAGQGRDHTGADEGGLPDPGGTDHDQDPRVPESAQAGREVVLAAEERVGVLGVVREQAPVGADGARLAVGPRASSDGSCRSSRCSRSTSSRPGIQAELLDQHRARPLHGAEGLALPAGLVQRGGQQRPAPLPERCLRDQGPRLFQLRRARDRRAPPPRRGAPRRPSADPRVERPPPAPAPTPRGRPAPARATGRALRPPGTVARAGSSPARASRPRSRRRSNTRWSSSSSPRVSR